MRIISSGVGVISRLLPEGKFKGFLKSYYYRYFHPLYVLDRLIRKIEMLPEGIMRLELNDGTIFYANTDEDTPGYMKYLRKSKLKKIIGFENSGSIFTHLYGIRDMYGLCKSVKRNSEVTIVDMGAHLGIFAIMAAKAVGDKARIIAIEADPKNLGLLTRNVKANKLGNIIVVSKGVWSKKDKLKFSVSNYSGASSFRRIVNTREFVEVDVDTLDNILEELGVKHVGFIKMNIEGAETEALKGMEKCLSSSDCSLVVVTHVVDGNQTFQNVSATLESKGFKVDIKGVLPTPTIYARKKIGRT